MKQNDFGSSGESKEPNEHCRLSHSKVWGLNDVQWDYHQLIHGYAHLREALTNMQLSTKLGVNI